MNNKLNNKISLIKILLIYAKPQGKLLVLLILISLIATIFATLQPAILSGFVNVVVTSQDANTKPVESNVSADSGVQEIFNLNKLGSIVQSLIDDNLTYGDDDIWKSLSALSLVFIVISFLVSVFNYLSEVVGRLIRARATTHVRSEVISHILFQNLSFVLNNRSGELISRIILDATNTAHGVGPLIKSFVYNSTLILMYSMYLFSTSIFMAFAVIVIILLQLIFTRVLKGPVKKVERGFYDYQAALTSSIQELLTTIRVIKSFGAEELEEKRMHARVIDASNADFRQGLVRRIEQPTRAFIDSLSMLGILIVGILEIRSGGLNLSGFLLFLLIGKLIISPINNLAVSLTWAHAVTASFERVNAILSSESDIKDGVILKDTFNRELEIKNIVFSYGKTVAINNISLDINKGEVVALVGPSGAGKSTFVDLLLRFYDVGAGSILVDGIPIKECQVMPYRKLFGVVPQECLLFNDTIYNNISFSNEMITREQVIHAAKIANAHEFILELQDGYDTTVGDRGLKLSGGQRQRISIARAVVNNPMILILDEATSALDSYSEKTVKVAIDNILKDSTAIIIAHRISTIKNADKIVVMNHGSVEAIGTHDCLLRESKTYAILCEQQL